MKLIPPAVGNQKRCPIFQDGQINTAPQIKETSCNDVQVYENI